MLFWLKPIKYYSSFDPLSTNEKTLKYTKKIFILQLTKLLKNTLIYSHLELVQIIISRFVFDKKRRFHPRQEETPNIKNKMRILRIQQFVFTHPTLRKYETFSQPPKIFKQGRRSRTASSSSCTYSQRSLLYCKRQVIVAFFN